MLFNVLEVVENAVKQEHGVIQINIGKKRLTDLCLVCYNYIKKTQETIKGIKAEWFPQAGDGNGGKC